MFYNEEQQEWLSKSDCNLFVLPVNDSNLLAWPLVVDLYAFFTDLYFIDFLLIARVFYLLDSLPFLFMRLSCYNQYKRW